MKLAFVLLGLFFFFVSMRMDARELTRSESLALIPFEKNKMVKSYFEENTDLQNLSYWDTLQFYTLKQSCLPLTAHINKISEEDSEYPDQTDFLLKLYGVCTEGNMGLAKLYIRAKGSEE